MDVLYDSNGKRYDPDTVLENLRQKWDKEQQLPYADFKLLWEIVGKMQAELKTYREMELDGREEYD